MPTSNGKPNLRTKGLYYVIQDIEKNIFNAFILIDSLN